MNQAFQIIVWAIVILGSIFISYTLGHDFAIDKMTAKQEAYIEAQDQFTHFHNIAHTVAE